MSEFLEETENYVRVKKGKVEKMETDALVYVDDQLRLPLFEELSTSYLPTFEQLASVCTLPGLLGNVVGLPDIHCGYGFPIGSVAAFNINDPSSIVSPGGVGYDINCGVRALASNLDYETIKPKLEKLADILNDTIPSGLGKFEGSNLKMSDLNGILDGGVDFLVKSKIVSEEDREVIEDRGYMPGDSRLLGEKSKGRGLNQLGSLGSGNHYLEVQYVDEIYDEDKANCMGMFRKGQIVVMIHTGSRGLGHQTCTDFLLKMNENVEVDVVDKQLASARINSVLGQNYLRAMGSAANYAWANRSFIAQKTRAAFEKIFPDSKLDLIYDVCHNIAKKEKHRFNGEEYDVLVHRKGASRSFPPHHESIPEKYKNIGQPVLIGGSMGTYSYILSGQEKSMDLTWGSSCHGAGRLLSRNQAVKTFKFEDIKNDLNDKNILYRCESSKGIVEEAPNSYKDVVRVAEFCEKIGVSKRVVRLKPVVVIKG